MAKITCKVAGKNLRRKTVISTEIVIDTVTPGKPDDILVASFPLDSRVAVDSVELVWSETLSGNTTIVNIGHIPLGGFMISNSLVAAASLTGNTIFSTTSLTLSEFLKTSSAWPNKPILPTGSSLWLDVANSPVVTSGKFYVVTHYWELDDQYD